MNLLTGLVVALLCTAATAQEGGCWSDLSGSTHHEGTKGFYQCEQYQCRNEKWVKTGIRDPECDIFSQGCWSPTVHMMIPYGTKGWFKCDQVECKPNGQWENTGVRQQNCPTGTTLCVDFNTNETVPVDSTMYFNCNQYLCTQEYDWQQNGERDLSCETNGCFSVVTQEVAPYGIKGWWKCDQMECMSDHSWKPTGQTLPGCSESNLLCWDWMKNETVPVGSFMSYNNYNYKCTENDWEQTGPGSDHASGCYSMITKEYAPYGSKGYWLCNQVECKNDGNWGNTGETLPGCTKSNLLCWDWMKNEGVPIGSTMTFHNNDYTCTENDWRGPANHISGCYSPITKEYSAVGIKGYWLCEQMECKDDGQYAPTGERLPGCAPGEVKCWDWMQNATVSVGSIMSYKCVQYKCSENDWERTTVRDPSCSDVTETCTEGRTWKQDCNDCICRNGQGICTTKACIPANWPQRGATLPPGAECSDQSSFKKECNDCACTNGRIICTFKACIPGYEHPPGTEVCKEGSLWKSDECNTCRCRDNKQLCAKRKCKDGAQVLPGLALAGVRPLAGATALQKTQVVEEEAECQIQEGSTDRWRKECNWCRCIKGKGVCTRRGCPPEINERLANEPECEGTVMFKKDCNWCSCVDGRSICTFRACLPGSSGRPQSHAASTMSAMVHRTQARPAPGTQDGKDEMLCTAGSVWRIKCNRCRCVEGKGVCTKKLCPPGLDKSDEPVCEGESRWKNKCNWCNCIDGQAVCTRRACVDRPFAPRNPTLVSVSNTEEECTSGSNWRNSCNWCRCVNGKGVCTRRACIPELESQLADKPECVGEARWKEKCNWCQCKDSKALCTLKACLPAQASPTAIGQIRDDEPECSEGSVWMNSCNRCQCRNGKAGCSKKACPPSQVLSASDKPECEGSAQWRKDCNLCQCREGRAVCTLRACAVSTPGRIGISGGIGAVQQADQETQQLLEGVREEVEQKLGRKVDRFTVISYSTQTVSGLNYYAKVQIGANEHINIVVYKHWSGTLSLTSVEEERTGRPGSLGAVQQADEETQQLLEGVREEVEQKLGRKVDRFTVISYSTQTVSGLNYYAKVQIGANEHINIVVYKHWSGTLSLTSVEEERTGVSSSSATSKPECLDGSSWKLECNSCMCSNGRAACTMMACLPGFKPKDDEEECSPGAFWKNDCNSCRCVNGKGVCTRMACIPRPPQAPANDICSLPAITPGAKTCGGFMRKWTYSSEDRECQQIVYGGCGGSENLFNTVEECQSACKRSHGAALFRSAGNRRDICKLPIVSGPCFASKTKFAFNQTSNRCERFYYGGCQGNANNFNSAQECFDECSGEPPVFDAGCDRSTCQWSRWSHYTAKGCLPQYDNGACCPTSFTCPSQAQSDPKICNYRGKDYSIGDEVPVTEDCETACTCAPGFAPGTGAEVRCASIECPDLFRPPQPNCRQLYRSGECCSYKQDCQDPDSPPQLDSQLVTCEWGNKTYQEGDRMYFDGEYNCQKCVCTRAFSGPTGPGCDLITCGLDFRYSSKFEKGCTPIFFENKCCPIDWMCPGDSRVESPLQTPPVTRSDSGVCRLGNIALETGAPLQLKERNCDVQCSCLTPPEFTCIKHRNCDMAKEQSSPQISTRRGNLDCPPVLCDEGCATLTDLRTGCQFCSCGNDVVTCPELSCHESCHKVQDTKSGCQRCECNCPKDPLGNPPCPMDCAIHYVKDPLTGCEKCECNPNVASGGPW